MLYLFIDSLACYILLIKCDWTRLKIINKIVMQIPIEFKANIRLHKNLKWSKAIVRVKVIRETK